MLAIQCDWTEFNCYCTIPPLSLNILWVCFPVLPKLADKSHKPVTNGLGWRSEASKNGVILLTFFFKYIYLYIYSFQGKKLVCMCLAQLCKCSQFTLLVLFVLVEKEKEKKEITTSAHFEGICPLFFKVLSHPVASSANVGVIFIKCLTVVKHKPDI